MRRKDRERDEAFALETLALCEYATLATVGGDGVPYCVPVSPVLTGRTLYFHCAPEGRKLDNIAVNPTVCVSCARNTRLLPEQYTTEFESAVAFGRCSLVADESEKLLALRLIGAKYSADYMDKIESAIDGALPLVAVCRIDITEITGKEKK